MAIFDLSKQAFSQWWGENVGRLGAALAFYSIFSLAPTLIIAIAVAGFALGEEAARGEIFRQMQDLIGENGALAIQSILRSASQQPQSSLMASIVSLVTLFVGATAAFAELQNGLNTVWGVTVRPGSSWLGVLRRRILSFGLVLTIGFLLLVSLLLSAAVSALGTFLNGYLPVPSLVLQSVNFLISFTVITTLFAMIYKVLPDVHIAWSDVWVGAAISSLLFSIGKLFIGLYLGGSGVGSAYGAAGSLVLILMWIFYSSQILYLGAEFTQVYANRFGSRLRPKSHAMPIAEKYRAAA